MLKAFWVLLLLTLSYGASATPSTPSVFYPLPTKAQGKVIAAKQLFLANGGGIWLQDVRNKVLFFDGLDVFPESGSALDHTPSKIAHLDNAFWSYFDNEIYRSIPNHDKELMFSLTAGIEIRNIGASQRYIWVSDDSNFYTYHVDSGEFKTYSLMEMYQYNPTVNIHINDARFILSKWVLATNSGVYLSNQEQFSHVVNSGKNYVEKIYFSPQRREIIVGSLSGALIFDIDNPTDPVIHVADEHVLSIAETSHEYWIGTEKGLFVYSHLNGETRRFKHGFWAGSQLDGEKIYALLNDNAGGMWIATDRGVRYFSQFSDKFQRHSLKNHLKNVMGDAVFQFSQSNLFDGYWLLTSAGLMRQSSLAEQGVEVYRGNISDFLEWGDDLYLASDQGITKLDAIGNQDRSSELPMYLRHLPTEFIEEQGERLWGASGKQLWSYQPSGQQVEQYGSDWMLEKYLPASLTHLSTSTDGSVALGTEHGLYLLNDGKVHFIAGSVQFGEVIDIEQTQDSVIWVAARYGLYQVNTRSRELEPVSLVDGHVTPQCLLSNDDGVWLTSSSGLSNFDFNGNLTQHYGEPFGLINNEFAASLCSYGLNGKQTLILGSTQSIVSVNTQELSVSALPKVHVIFSQIKLNQTLYSLGNSAKGLLRIGYGDSLTFQLGMLPRAADLELEYRLGQTEEWSSLEGTTLAIEHLLPGHYRLEVRAVNGDDIRSNHANFEFAVAKPWFLTGYAIAAYFIMAGVVIISTVYWRSRMMLRANQALKEQVALKTNQLSHQSRILLTNNHQLRKQLQVRRLIFSQSVNSLKDRVQKYDIGSTHDSKEAMRLLTDELELLLNVREVDGEALPVYNLTLIISSVLRGWHEEFIKAGVSVRIPTDEEVYVKLSHFNLDELFTVLFDGIIKRSYRNQTILGQIATQNGKVSLRITDEGDAIGSPVLSDASTQNLGRLVEQSGGEMEYHSSSERNLIEIVWPEGETFDDRSVVELTDDTTQQRDAEQDPWLEKVRALVAEHFSDANFGTASAAKLMFVSERSLQRRFKQSMERTFTEYLTEVRLDHACQQLLAGAKISDVAFDCGFNDPSYFSQRFKHRFGMSPTQFIEGHEA